MIQASARLNELGAEDSLMLVLKPVEEGNFARLTQGDKLCFTLQIDLHFYNKTSIKV